MSSMIKVSLDGHILTLTLNRPEKKNAFNRQMIDEWVEALEEAQRNDAVRVIVITGAGDAFCSGGDVRNEGAGGHSPGREK